MDSKQRKSLPPRARPQKPPALHRRGQSYNTAQSQSASSNAKSTYGGNKRASVEVFYQEGDEDQGGMSSFCTTCEKQIVTPGASILYCSEACRKRDVSRPASIQSVALSPAAMPPSAGYFDTPPLTIVPKRSPTAARPASLAFSDLNLSSESDSTSEEAESQHSYDSEAARYLSQFYAESHASDGAATRRPRVSRNSTACESGIPSLSHTPSSSIGTVASAASYRQPTSRQGTAAGHHKTKSADVVLYPSSGPPSLAHPVKAASMTSSTSTLTSLHAAERAEVAFNRRELTQNRLQQSGGSLRHLLNRERS